MPPDNQVVEIDPHAFICKVSAICVIMNSALIWVPREFGLATLSLMYSPGFVNGTKDHYGTFFRRRHGKTSRCCQAELRRIGNTSKPFSSFLLGGLVRTLAEPRAN